MKETTEIKGIKYFESKCSECDAVYTINLKLHKKELSCYKCGCPLEKPEIDMEKVQQANKAMEAVESKFVLVPDGDGLVLTKRYDYQV